jgi:hypothetical protein
MLAHPPNRRESDHRWGTAVKPPTSSSFFPMGGPSFPSLTLFPPSPLACGSRAHDTVPAPPPTGRPSWAILPTRPRAPSLGLGRNPPDPFNRGSLLLFPFLLFLFHFHIYIHMLIFYAPKIVQTLSKTHNLIMFRN